MKFAYKAGQSLPKTKAAPLYGRLLRTIVASILILPLTLSGLPGTGMFRLIHRPGIQNATTLTLIADADAYVKQASPDANYGNTTVLQVDGAGDPEAESFLHFTVAGLSGTVREARLRLYDTKNGTRNGPVLYTTGTSWTEAGLTWNNRPGRTSGVIGDQGAIRRSSWIEYNVTALVSGDGTYSFVLAADSSDGVRFYSREGRHPPELVLSLNAPENTPGVTSTPSPESTVTATPFSTLFPTETPTLTPLPTLTSTQTPAVETATPTLTSTPPPVSTSIPSGGDVLVGAGDISRCSNNNDEETARLLDSIPGTVFTTGDNVYDSGSYTEFINCYEPTWGRHKARTNPAPGNHDYVTSGAAGYFQYFNNFSAFYAYNLGAWRIYALNSEIDVSASSSQATWLQSDLALNPTQCVLAYWHKPRWSSGSEHGSNPGMQTLWQILSAAGAEVVLNGHDHDYERFAEMDASGSAVPQGLREFVVGTGGASHYPFGAALSTSQVRNDSTYGVLKLTLNAGGYDWQFVPVAGSSFTDSGSGTCH